MPFHFLWEKYLKVIDLTFITMAPFLSCIISHSYLPLSLSLLFFLIGQQCTVKNPRFTGIGYINNSNKC